MNRLAIWALALALVAFRPALAELRIWTTADQRFSTVAELVRVEDDKAVLRKPSGQEIRVPLRLLSAEDRAFALGKPPSDPGGASAEAKTRPLTLAEVERELEGVSTGKNALLLVELHLASGRLSDSDAAQLRSRLPYWLDLADRGMVRLGERWVGAEEAEAARKASTQKVDDAIELLRLGNGRLAERVLQEASELDPSNPEAEFVMGVVWGAIVDDDRRAAECFREAVKRDPSSVGALNNLAVSEVFLRRFDDAIGHWVQAAELDPDNRALSQNLASMLAVANRPGVRVPAAAATLAASTYSRLLSEHKHPRPVEGGFVYLPPRRFAKGEKRAFGESDGQLISVASGTGFVVAPGMIVTNEHVVEGADGLLILDPENSSRRVPANIVAVSKEDDLALVRCDDLRAAAIPVSEVLPGRGADVMVLGFPLGPEFGTNLKTTRGAIVALPSADRGSMLLYDAITNPGNSGGPLCDAAGRVIGVVRVLYTGAGGGSYGGAIPMSRAAAFLRQHGVAYNDSPGSGERLEWTEVDRRVAPSTVLILNRQRSSGGGIVRDSR